MDIQFQKNDDLSAKMTITFTPEDYQQNVEKQLKQQQKSVLVKGFRQGKAPMGMVKKMYGQSILINEINEMTSKTVTDYLNDNKIDILARPLESEDQEALDFENPKDFTLKFDLGLAPEVVLNISDKDVVTKYKIILPESEIDEEIKYLAERHGEMTDKELVEDGDLIYAAVNELDNEGKHIEDGIHHKHISFSLKNIEDKEIKDILIGKKKDAIFNIDLFKVFKNDKKMVQRTLEVSEEILNDLNPVFELEIHEIKTLQPAEINEALFNNAFPNSNITDEESFRNKLKENIDAYYEGESDKLFEHYLYNKLESNHPIEVPEDFIKRWLLESKGSEYNEDNVDERLANEVFALKRTLIREKVAEENKIEISNQEIEDTAIAYNIGIFRQYGLQSATPEMVKGYTMDKLKESDFRHQIYNIVQTRKVTEVLKGIVTIQEEEISKDDFFKKVNEQRAQ